MTPGTGLLAHGLAASAAATAVVVAIPGQRRLSPSPAPRGRALGGARSGLDGEPPERDAFERYRLPLAVLAGLTPLWFLGGIVGLLAGAVTGVVVHRALGARESAATTRRREAVEQSLPHVVDLLAVALAAGAAPSRALSAVAAAVEGVVAEDLRAAEHALGLGLDPVRVWRDVAGRPGLAALGRTMGRAVETGASVSGALARLAEDLAASSRMEAESRARAVGVRATAPLGLCLLPAFVLVGIVPLVVGTAGSIMGR